MHFQAGFKATVGRSWKWNCFFQKWILSSSPSQPQAHIPAGGSGAPIWEHHGGRPEMMHTAFPCSGVAPRLRELGWFRLEKRRLQRNLRAAFQFLKGAYRKEGEQLFMWADSDRIRGSGFKLIEGRLRLGYQEEIISWELAQVVPRSCGLPVPGSVQGQVGLDFEQPGIVEDISAQGGGIRWALKPLQPKPFCYCMNPVWRSLSICRYQVVTLAGMTATHTWFSGFSFGPAVVCLSWQHTETSQLWTLFLQHWLLTKPQSHCLECESKTGTQEFYCLQT